MRRKNHEHFNYIRRLFACVCGLLFCACSCQNIKFGVSDLEHTGDARALLALCYRAQKDNAASGGGNTRNCDDVQSEAIRYVRFDVCQAVKTDRKADCLCAVYKICDNEKN